MLKYYLQENNMLCLNTHFQKRHVQLWTHNSPNDFKSQIDIIINKKWKNSVKKTAEITTLLIALRLITV